jgi:hypothetical protein
MTTKVRITLEESTGCPVEIRTVTTGKAQRYSCPQFLQTAGDYVEVYVHANQDVVVGEIKPKA